MKRSHSKKRAVQQVLFSRLFILVGVVLLGFILVGIAKGAVKEYRVDQEIEALEKEITSLEKENTNFSQLITYLQSDAFVEQEAKRKLGLRREGEQVVVIPQRGTSGTGAENKTNDVSNFVKWWQYFFGNN